MHETRHLATTPADAFGADLYGLLSADDKTAPASNMAASNMAVSPASIDAALRLALCGARGETAAELASALHVDAGDVRKDPGSSLREIKPAGSFRFRMANTAWVQQGLPLEPGYTERIREDAAATLASTDFIGAPEKARTTINDSIAEQTEDKITDLLAPGIIGTDTRLVLANAIYLKAQWTDQFPVTATADAPFHLAAGNGDRNGDRNGDGNTVQVPMMHSTAARQYVRGDGYQAVLLRYAESPLAMAIVLPDGPLAGLRAKVAEAGLRTLLAGTQRHQVVLALPRFRVRTRFDLIPALRQLGVRAAFSDNDADFTGITRAEQLFIGAVAHMAYVDVDEYGTEAAAATAVVMRTLAMMRPPPHAEMTVDRPFLFAIVDTGTGDPLFLGQVVRPER